MQNPNKVKLAMEVASKDGIIYRVKYDTNGMLAVLPIASMIINRNSSELSDSFTISAEKL